MPNDRAPHRILVVRNDRIGDLVLTLPAIEAIRTHFPQSQLTLLASPYAGPLVEGHPAIDELLLDDPAQNAWALSRQLRAGRYDAALVINTNTRNALAVRLSGIRQRVCWGYKPVGRLTATHPVNVHRSRPPIHEAAFAMEFAKQLGVMPGHDKHLARLPLDQTARQRLARRIGECLGTVGPLVGVHPGNKNSAYNWPPSHYAELVRQLAGSARVVVTGGADERELVARVCAAEQKHALGLTDLSLAELTALVAELDVLVVSSTGPMHLAGAVGTPVVALFSPHPAHVPAKWAPLGDNHTLLVAPLAEGEDPSVPRERGTELMSRISVEEVAQATLRQASRAGADDRAA